MPICPSDPALRVALRKIFARRSNGQKTIWIGYNNLEHLMSPGELMNASDMFVMNSFAKIMSWKAVMHIYQNRDMQMAAIAESGTGYLYGLRQRANSGHPSWASPEESVNLALRQLINRE